MLHTCVDNLDEPWNVDLLIHGKPASFKKGLLHVLSEAVHNSLHCQSKLKSTNVILDSPAGELDLKGYVIDETTYNDYLSRARVEEGHRLITC